MIPRITLRDATDADVIIKALALYVTERGRMISLEKGDRFMLSLELVQETTWIEQLIRDVSAGTMGQVTSTPQESEQ